MQKNVMKTRISRRKLIKISLAMSALAACSPFSPQISKFFPGWTPSSTGTPTLINTTAQPTMAPGKYSALTWLAANRLTFGPLTSDLDWIEKNGVDAFIEEQLAFEKIDDQAVQNRLAGFTTLTQTSANLFLFARTQVLHELQASALLHAVYSQHQLFELMVDFWTNHFNIDFNKAGDFGMKTVDDREVIRKYALGSFRDLLGASAHSPAMLINLDNNTNHKSQPNENYARELMELQTIGIDGGYSQHDVTEVARAFTGWTLYGSKAGSPQAGTFRYLDSDHDQGQKTILSQIFPAKGGEKDGEQVLDLLANHASAAHFISAKLTKRFISDSPPETVVQAGAAAFQKSKGDMRAVLSAILHSPEFKNSSGQKTKRPLEYTASILRMLNAEISDAVPALGLIANMGQPLFLWPAPNGFPDTGAAWINSGVLLNRWNLAIALVNNSIKGIKVDIKSVVSQNGDLLNQWVNYLLPVALPPDVLDALKPFADPGSQAELVSLLLSSPIFQMRG